MLGLPLIGAAVLFAAGASAAPRPDSSSGDEVAVSAPYGVILSDTAELSSQLASESAAATVSSSWYAAATTAAAASYVPPAASSAYYPPPVASSAYYPPPAASSAYYPPPDAYSSSSDSAYVASATVSYGSGSSSWDSGYSNSGYDSCVQQCVASFGAPPATWTPPPTSSSSSYDGSDSSDSSGSGVTHTVIVAPTQGILRYVPFVVNASVGDTVMFMWGANNHTVTKSSELTICNKTSDAPFASGEQNEGFTFTQVVNDTNPTFFYCGTPTHCEKGMFGIINPPSIYNAETSVSNVMPQLAMNDSSMAAMSSYAQMQTANNSVAASWGSNIDLAQMPSWSHQFVAENVLYGRTFIAANPDIVQADGSLNLNTGTPLMLPQDITSAATADNSTSASGSASSPSGTLTASSGASSASASGSGTAAAAAASHTNGAASKAASGAILGLAAIAAVFLAL
ncbi:hypothetical protein CERSUDRAFT_113717 [Gelatoporia subvermispora B]|uniref:Phytocyanin domain-containing protein n=1 Tax=Ceriporiopsis subvermispora (strain B) TaxID=914234 RepID=M2PPU0_CERS8|nr:hypothetical protein CERSUDRAFT_113717 [Gelatoporia subvermispora B]